jgi:hypothetical protein
MGGREGSGFDLGLAGLPRMRHPTAQQRGAFRFTKTALRGLYRRGGSFSGLRLR